MIKQNEIILKKLKSLGNATNIKGMARFGIKPNNAYGVLIPNLRKFAKEIGKDHVLAQQLWDSKIHEAKILASMIDKADLVTKKQADQWIKDFDSWDICDQVCLNLFNKTLFAFEKAAIWTKKKAEFEKRAGFALMACLAWQDKRSSDEKFLNFFPLIKKHSIDGRNFVKKAVNWALRQIGKRNNDLRIKAIKLAMEIQKIDSKTAKWIASDAIKELTKIKIKKTN
ncbi:MAG: DNA alkylation repair protein [Patescibacteria group bacterium]|nr:DNA alkylation repair protein [Patescibacteria group bacterium]MBU1870515.1 DNA alkylation repair protein [Patescibacteria group bacterium]